MIAGDFRWFFTSYQSARLWSLVSPVSKVWVALLGLSSRVKKVSFGEQLLFLVLGDYFKRLWMASAASLPVINATGKPDGL